MDGRKPTEPGSPSSSELAGMGVELAAAVAGGSLLGYWIDRHFGTDPWGLLGGAGVGIIGGLYNMIRKTVRESMRMSNRDQNLQRRSSSGGSNRDDGNPPEKGES